MLQDKIKSKITPLFYIILFSLVIHFFSINHAFKHPGILQTTDSHVYLNAAYNFNVTGIFHSGSSVIPSSLYQYSHRPPAYPLIISMLKKIWDSDYAIIILQVLLNYINVFLLWKIMHVFKIHEKIKLVIAAAFLLYPPQIFFTYMIIAEILLQTFLLLSLLCLALYLDSKKIKFLIYLNLMLCFAVLTKPLFIYFWIPNIIFHIIIFLRNRKRLILLMPLLLIVVIFSWSFRNYYHTDYFHYSSSKHRNILNYYLENYLSSQYGKQFRIKFRRKVNMDIAKMDFPEASSYIEKLGRDIIISDWFNYSQFHLRGAVFYFVDPGRFEFYKFLDLESRWNRGFQYQIINYGLIKGSFELLKQMPTGAILYLIAMGLINTAFSLLFFCSILKRTNLFEFKVFLILVVFYVAIITGPLGASRYRLPIFPYMLVAISMFINKPNAADDIEQPPVPTSRLN